MKLIILQKNNLCSHEHAFLCMHNKWLNMQYLNNWLVFQVLTVSLLLFEKHDPKQQAPLL